MLVQIHKGRIISPYTQTQISGKFDIESFKKKRSNPQNAYYWGILIKEIANETGYTPEETHAKLAYKFLLVKEGSQPFVRSTTSLKTAEMEEYNENVRRWASDFLSLYLPLPNEYSEGDE